MDSIAHKNTECRYCHSKNLYKFLSLGDQPLADSFIDPSEIMLEKKYPLDVYFCENCFLVQLLDVVPKEVLFENYLYLSSTSKALKAHYAETAAILTKQLHLKKDDLVVDIGCNDGILLQAYEVAGLKKVGVEPSNVAEVANKAGLTVIQKFFDKKVTKQIVKKYGAARLVTTTNVFAHVDKIDDFVDALVPLLGKDGVFVIEAPYLIDLIDKTLFDTIYHEHLCYLSLTPMISFFDKHGLEVFNVERIPIGASGPAIRIFVQRKNGGEKIIDSVSEMLKMEEDWGVGEKKTYIGYSRKIEKIKKEVIKKIRELKKQGKKIGGYGAPAKGNTLLNYFQITSDMIDSIAETSSVKIGLVTPGTHIPIVSEEEFLSYMPDYALLMAWNYLDFFLEKSEYVKKGGKFLVPLPNPVIVP